MNADILDEEIDVLALRVIAAMAEIRELRRILMEKRRERAFAGSVMRSPSRPCSFHPAAPRSSALTTHQVATVYGS